MWRSQDEFVVELEHLHAAAKVPPKSTAGIIEKTTVVEQSLPSPHRPAGGQQQQPQQTVPPADDIDASDEVQDIRAAKPSIAIETGAISHPLRKTADSIAPAVNVDGPEADIIDEDDDDDHTDDASNAESDDDDADEVSNDDDAVGAEETTVKIPPPKVYIHRERVIFKNPRKLVSVENVIVGWHFNLGFFNFTFSLRLSFRLSYRMN